MSAKGHDRRPQTLVELFEDAKRDLAGNDPMASLKWAFKNAQAVARLASADRALKRVEAAEWELNSRLLMGGVLATDDGTKARLLREMPSPQEVEHLRGEFEDATAWVKATENVMELLQRRAA